MTRDTSRADAVWEKYRHMDQCMSDVRWLETEPSFWRAEIIHDLWLAVRAAAGQEAVEHK